MATRQGKTESPTGVDADQQALTEKMKEFCPIVITTVDCRPTKFKDADGNVLSLKDADGKRLELKDKEKYLSALKDIGVEEVAKSSAEGRNKYKLKKDGKPVEAMDFEFDQMIGGKENDDDAHFLVDLKAVKKEGGTFSSSYNVFAGRDIVGGGIATQIDQVAKEKFDGATHCMLYLHGFMAQPQVTIDSAMAINEKWKRDGEKAFCIPVVWPAEKLAYWTQKKHANGAALGLKNSILPFLKHECKHGGGTKVKISIMCHSMGNYVLKKMAPEEKLNVFIDEDENTWKKQETPAFRFDNIFMVASDVRATTFDVKKGFCKVEDADGKPDYDHDGEDILRLAKHKLHVCWYGSDLALLGRRAMPNSNYGRAALGRSGLNSKYNRKLILDPEKKLCDVNCAEWNKQIASSFGRLLGHSYQTEDKALAYYLENMRKYPEDKP